MTRVENRPLKLFLNEHCTISYRQDKRGSWTNEGRPDYTLLFTIHGKVEYQTNNEKREITAGKFVLANPGARSKCVTRRATALSLTIAPALVVDVSLRMGLARTTNDILLRDTQTLEDPAMTRLISDLSRELSQGEPGHETVIAALVDHITVHLLRHYATFRRADSLELSRVGFVDRRIRRAIELMVAQLDQELSLKDLAAASYLSPFHFARLFKKLTGVTPHSYLAALRTMEAQRLLAETELPIAEISIRVGYASPSHFTRGFRQATGLTPRAFRTSLISRRLKDR